MAGPRYEPKEKSVQVNEPNQAEMLSNQESLSLHQAKIRNAVILQERTSISPGSSSFEIATTCCRGAHSERQQSSSNGKLRKALLHRVYFKTAR
ncbi:hypothetical protein MAR_019463 [Mya arenaria]|uniref:Uncharacterized protein n=1 Tax=Mya arenaria TaxID=6604 RepID=A0ABY7E4H0_MYAAR|nr:hypothetical protein MAR_019463 [Mya arenaria]